jgi:hypothetical protein
MTQGFLLGLGIFGGLLVGGLILSYIVELAVVVGCLIGVAFLSFYVGWQIALLIALGIALYFNWKRARSAVPAAARPTPAENELHTRLLRNEEWLKSPEGLALKQASERR